MSPEQAIYLAQYFPRLFTEQESAARKHHLYTTKLATVSPKSYQKYQQWYLERGLISLDQDVLQLLEDGYAVFLQRAADRIARESPHAFCFNECPVCGALTRTPYARQCFRCYHRWYDRVVGKFILKDIIRITSQQALFFVGDITDGEIAKGDLLDLTGCQLNMQSKIHHIEMVTRDTISGKNVKPRLGD